MRKLLRWMVGAMFFASAAQAQIVPSLPYNLTNGSLADATQVMGNFNALLNGVNSNAATAGANTDITSLTGLTTPLGSAYGGTVLYTGGTTGGSANAQTLATVSPSNFALTAGNFVSGIAGYTNSGATTLATNSTAATAVRVSDATGLHALVGGEIYTGNSYTFYFDGTYYILLNPSILTSGNIPSSAALAGSPTTTTQSANDNSTKIATTAYVDNGVAGKLAYLATQTITSTATYTPTAGMTECFVRMVGGGGGGGGANGNGGSGAGGGGEYAEGWFTSTDVGASQTATIGAAGAAGTNSPTAGGTGGTTSLGTLLTAVGGSGGVADSGTNGGAAGGTGGSSSAGTGIQHIAGGPGGAYLTSTSPAGKGGDSRLGFGGAAPASDGTINAGKLYGGGSSGSIGGSSHAGAVGAKGVIIITEYE